MTTPPTSQLDPSIARSTTQPLGGLYTAVTKPPNAKSGELGKDAFLKLLVAQMKYQDPMSPASNTDFIAQTAQFTVVEKLQEMAEMNQKLLASQNQLTASTFIGRDVAWSAVEGGTTVTKSGTVTGISFTADGPRLRVDGKDIALADITAVAPIIEQPGEDDGTDQTGGTDETGGADAPTDDTGTTSGTTTGSTGGTTAGTPSDGTSDDDPTSDPTGDTSGSAAA
jgi:flagellar basal-body rod modification protein FlgD